MGSHLILGKSNLTSYPNLNFLKEGMKEFNLSNFLGLPGDNRYPGKGNLNFGKVKHPHYLS